MLEYLRIISTFSWSISVTLIILCIYFSVRFKIKRIEKKRVKSIKKRQILDAVETESPIEDQESSLRQRGLSEIEDKFSFFKKSLPILLGIFWLILVILPKLNNVPGQYISIIAAIISVIAGFSLKPFLENLFSGVVISFFKSIKIGDTVQIDGQYGLIEEIGLTYSVLRRWDWNRIVIPNSKLLQKEIQNLTMNDTYLWAHIEFYVSPDSNMEEVESEAINVAKNSPYFNGIEPPSFWVMDIQKDTIKCWLAAWCDSPSDAWELRNELRTNLLKVFQRKKIQLHRFNLSNNH